ncbi:TadE family protein [Streptomyces niveus]|uniref:TadE family protein n=1 Tax=Streptomyces niveus TaxID=193462 RepID=UPI0036931275
MPPRCRLHRWWAGAVRARVRDRGAVEWSMVMPMALLMLLTLVQAGIWFHARSAAQHAAQSGVDAERVHNAPAGAGRSAAHDVLERMGGSVTAPSVTVERAGGQVSVQVDGEAILLLPGMSVRVSERVRAPAEEFTP